MVKQLFKILSVFMLMFGTGCASSSNECPKDASKDIKKSFSENNSILGTWTGVLEVGSKLTITFDIFHDVNGILNAKLGCLEQGLADCPAEIMYKNDELKFKIKKIGATYDGFYDKEKSEFCGTFKQSGTSIPLILKKGEKLIVSRPQEPKKPYPYKEEQINFFNPTAKVTLAGTLTLPYSENPCPAVLLIAGSGPNDRNEEIFGHKPFLVLADHLTNQGIAVLRIDKRGVGESTGNYDTATSKDFSDDVLAGIEYLKNRKEIDIKQIGLIGHSEGGIIAPMVAAKSKDIAYIVLMAGSGVNGEEILYEQGALISHSRGANKEQIEKQRELQKQIFSIIKKESDYKIAENQLRDVIAKDLSAEQKESNSDVIEAQIKRVNSNWFRYFLTCDPTVNLIQIKIPVLVLNGEFDLQVSSKQNLPAIEKALKKAGNKDYTIIEFPKLNHLFQTCKIGSVEEYGKIEETIAPKVLNAISEWILQRINDNSSRSKNR